VCSERRIIVGELAEIPPILFDSRVAGCSFGIVTLQGGVFAVDAKCRAANRINIPKGNRMSYVLIRHKIANYAKWKQAVHACAAWRKASGELGFQVFRSAKAPNDLTVVCRWANSGQARKFVSSAELRQRMREAGVIGKPEIHFFKGSEDLSVA
jgi:heme-degrading monooxygenase HmoA